MRHRFSALMGFAKKAAKHRQISIRPYGTANEDVQFPGAILLFRSLTVVSAIADFHIENRPQRPTFCAKPR